MKVLSVVNLKGGSGKTTTAVFLAHAFQKLGENVALVDADPQASAADWAELVDEEGGAWPVQYLRMPEKTIHKRLSQILPNDITLAIIDSPPFEEQRGIVTSVLRASDFAIIAMGPTMIELKRTLDIWNVIEDLDPMRDTPLRTHVLFNRVIPNASSTSVIQGELESLGHEVLSARVPRREQYAQAYGESVTDLGTYFDAALELRQKLEGAGQ